MILNTGGVINAAQLTDIADLDAILMMGQAGMRGGHALAEVMTGEVTPSGKTVDTWAADYSDYPSAEGFSKNDGNVETEDYSEGIFVGYRYFDTFGIDPIWEFGYGLSYTDFEFTTATNAPIDIDYDNRTITVKANVKNTGTEYSGKEVMQLYVSAPEGDISKPYQELVGYAKTEEIEPGDSDDVEITFTFDDMASYSEKEAAYVLEEGDYILRLGDSSRNTFVAGILHLDKGVKTEQLSNLTFGKDNNNKIDDDMEGKKHNHITYAGEAEEIDNSPVINLDSEKINTLDNKSGFDESINAYTTEKDVYVPSDGVHEQTAYVLENAEEYKTLVDVYKAPAGKRTEALYKLIAQMSYEELATIAEGIGMGGFTGAVGTDKIGDTYVNTPGAAGETTFKYFDKYKIPNTVLSDGPAGIRITQEFVREGKTYYQFATAFPIGTVLAQTWNVDLIEEVGKAVGEEMVEFGVTMWLAPGMNIHRNPLCGRNFEYYSEDPTVAGETAAAITNGVQSNKGVGVTLKHYTTNNQEENRNQEDNRVSERAMREIYLKGFEKAVKKANPMAIMTCYNKINGTFGAGNYDTCTNILRGEWGFNGVVMTDWMSAEEDKNSMHAGNDMIQPGGSPEDIYRYLDDTDVPEWGDDGYVTISEGYSWWGTITYTPNWREFTPSEDGESIVVSKEAAIKYADMGVDSDATNEDLIKAALAKGLNENVKDYVDDGIAEVTVTKRDTDTASFAVTYKGDYTPNELNLGDVQRSVFNILKVVMASNQFGLTLGKDSAEYTFDDYIKEKWTAADKNEDISEEDFEPAEAPVIVPDKPKASDDSAAKYSKETKKAMSENKPTMSANVALDSTYAVEYNQAAPFFGKSVGKDFEKVFGEIKVKVGDKTAKATKIKLVKIKGATPTSWNAAIQIVKTDDKSMNKDVKKLTKVDKKNAANNKLPVQIYAMNLDSAVSENQISDIQIKGSSGKFSLKLKFASTGKKFTAKQKKDTYGNAYVKFEKDKDGNWILESGDLKGTIPKEKVMNDKSK